MSMKMPDQSGMVCSSYWSRDHITMVCENWIPRLILDSTGNNILGTLISYTTIYEHQCHGMSINFFRV
jgi:hypothetical protein